MLAEQYSELCATARRMGCSLWQNHVYGADAPAARDRPQGVHRRGVEVVLSYAGLPRQSARQ
jgi:hypothetical protein